MKIDNIAQFEKGLQLAEDIMKGLSPEAILQLCGGNEKDVDKMIDVISEEAMKVAFGGQYESINQQSFDYLDNVAASVEESLRVLDINYFLTTVISNFDINWHHIEWGSFLTKYNKLCLVAARDHGKSYWASNIVPIWKMYRYENNVNAFNYEHDLQFCAKGAIITNEQSLGEELMEILKDTVESSPILAQRLVPDNKNDWAIKKIKTKNGARLQAKSYGTKFRGRHPGYVVVDDFLDDSCLYSKDQRTKFNNYFHSVIMNAVLKDGQALVVGTPFHESDLYGDLKKKKNWAVFEYPSIFPDGRALWDRRYNVVELLTKRDDQGELIFSREHLCRPVVSNASLFPRELLANITHGMSLITLVNSREEYPVKFDFVVTACDFAMSSSVGADYSVFLTAGVDEVGKTWLMHYYRNKGQSFSDQIAALKSINNRFHPDLVLAEANQFQQIFVDEASKSGLPVVPHVTTGGNKNDMLKGVPSLSITFARHNMKFPVGDRYSKDFAELAKSELGAIAFTDKGIQGVGEHDDIAIATWLLDKASKVVTQGFVASM